MAVIMELEGGRIRIHDDMIVKTKEENDKIIENVSRIMINAAYRRMKEEQEKTEQDRKERELKTRVKLQDDTGDLSLDCYG